MHYSRTECFLVVGDAPGEASFLEIEQLFDTQVGPIIGDSYVVALDDIPEFLLPGLLTTGRTPALAPGGHFGKPPPGVAPWARPVAVAPEVVTSPDGQRVIRFPFTIPGL